MTLAGLVRQAYPSPEWAVFLEVGNATGFRTRRHADAVALGIWPSRGHTLIGFEFKEDRRDWLREKRDPAKADEIAAHCDGWYLVIGREGIATVEELPEPWGLYVANPDRTKLKLVKTCQPFQDRDKSIMKRAFAAAMLRRVSETTIPKVELDRIVEERVAAAIAFKRESRELDHLRSEVERLKGILQTFKDQTGLELDGWNGPKKLTAAVHALLNLDSDKRSLVHAKHRLELSVRTINEALEAWPTTSVEVEEAAG